MAFTGDLQHLPIVDVIQLMNSTRKSGVLSIKGRKGESQLVFKEGFIVSASHLNNSVRIGQVLVEMGFVSELQIADGLKQQQLDGNSRRPLAITLIEMEVLKEQDAYKALQHLIEMTVVEILTWKSGKFTLDHLQDVIECDFRYYPEKMNHEINVNTQSILMDALRIFDEKMRDGLIIDEPEEPAAESDPADLISEDDLGLAEMDIFEQKLPKSFTAAPPFDPVSFQRNKISIIAKDLPDSEMERLAAFLAPYTKEEPEELKNATLQLCIRLSDRLLSHLLETCLPDCGLAVLTENHSERQIAANAWLLTDDPAESNPMTILLSSSTETKDILDAYKTGVRAVMPKPWGAGYVDEMILLLETLPMYLKTQR